MFCAPRPAFEYRLFPILWKQRKWLFRWFSFIGVTLFYYFISCACVNVEKRNDEMYFFGCQKREESNCLNCVLCWILSLAFGRPRISSFSLCLSTVLDPSTLPIISCRKSKRFACSFSSHLSISFDWSFIVLNPPPPRFHHSSLLVAAIYHRSWSAPSRVKIKMTLDGSERLNEVATLAGHTDRVWHAAWNPQGTLLATCSSDLVSRSGFTPYVVTCLLFSEYA